MNGVRLHCVTAGEPSKKLVMFLHGFPEFWYEWKKQLREFGKDHFVVAPGMCKPLAYATKVTSSECG